MSETKSKKSSRLRLPRETSRLREYETSAADAKSAILSAANILAGALGLLESLERGMLAGDALRKEVKKGTRRSRALAKIEREEG